MAVEFREGFERYGLKVRIAMHILDEVVPKILNTGVFIGERIATAFSWIGFVCKYRPAKCSDLNTDVSKWSQEELKKVARKLIEFASELLVPALKS